MNVETDPLRREKMEANARNLIGSLSPNSRLPILGWGALIVSFLMGIATIKSFIEQTVFSSWKDSLAFFALIGFITVFLRCAQLSFPLLKFDRNGIHTRTWFFSAAKTYDWGSIIACEGIWLGTAYETNTGISIKTGSSGDFDNTLYTAYSIFENRYSLEK